MIIPLFLLRTSCKSEVDNLLGATEWLIAWIDAATKFRIIFLNYLYISQYWGVHWSKLLCHSARSHNQVAIIFSSSDLNFSVQCPRKASSGTALGADLPSSLPSDQLALLEQYDNGSLTPPLQNQLEPFGRWVFDAWVTVFDGTSTFTTTSRFNICYSETLAVHFAVFF